MGCQCYIWHTNVGAGAHGQKREGQLACSSLACEGLNQLLHLLLKKICNIWLPAASWWGHAAVHQECKINEARKGGGISSNDQNPVIHWRGYFSKRESSGFSSRNCFYLLLFSPLVLSKESKVWSAFSHQNCFSILLASTRWIWEQAGCFGVVFELPYRCVFPSFWCLAFPYIHFCG